jgi:hypothetical protein
LRDCAAALLHDAGEPFVYGELAFFPSFFFSIIVHRFISHWRVVALSLYDSHALPPRANPCT